MQKKKVFKYCMCNGFHGTSGGFNLPIESFCLMEVEGMRVSTKQMRVAWSCAHNSNIYDTIVLKCGCTCLHLSHEVGDYSKYELKVVHASLLVPIHVTLVKWFEAPINSSSDL